MSGQEMLLIALAVLSFLGASLQALLIVLERRRKRRSQETVVIASVILVEEDFQGEEHHWYVTASWKDTNTQRVYTFHSSPFILHLKLHVGDTLAVTFNPAQPQRYQMHF